MKNTGWGKGGIPMAKRRITVRENIRKWKNGCWEGRCTVGDDLETGKRITKNAFGRIQAEIKERLKRAMENNKRFEDSKRQDLAVGQWVTLWFEKLNDYLRVAEEHGVLWMFHLELTTDLRRGELLALLWTDLDIKEECPPRGLCKPLVQLEVLTNEKDAAIKILECQSNLNWMWYEFQIWVKKFRIVFLQACINNNLIFDRGFCVGQMFVRWSTFVRITLDSIFALLKNMKRPQWRWWSSNSLWPFLLLLGIVSEAEDIGWCF